MKNNETEYIFIHSILLKYPTEKNFGTCFLFWYREIQ
jgi:hypothetical protein